MPSSNRIRKNKTRPIRAAASLPVMNPHAAGIDIGAHQIYVCVPPDTCAEPIWTFDTFTEDLHALTSRLKECGIASVAMESTGVYWIPLYQILEDSGISVTLVNPGYRRSYTLKTDVEDCQKLQYLHSVGLLSGSFRPAQQVCAVRSIMRHRTAKIQEAAAHVQRMQKSLDQMNLRLHNVISDITGLTGLAIIDAILAGERNPAILALRRDRRIKATQEEIAKSLVGDYRPEHLFTLAQELESYRFCQAQIAKCDAQIGRMLAQFDSQDGIMPPSDPNHPPARHPKSASHTKNDIRLPDASLTAELERIYGVDITLVPGMGASSAFALFTEVGANLSAFASAAHFASYAGLCPQNQVSGGKVLRKGTRKVKSRIADILRVAAQSLTRSQGPLGDFYRRQKWHLGSSAAAITALAHKLARILYQIIITKKPYDESVFQEQIERTKQKRIKKLHKDAQSFGFTITPA